MTPSRRRRSLAILTALPLAALSLAAAASPALADHGDRVEHIAKARRQALRTTVTVRGTVTVPSNAFDAGFAIQDGNAGIYVLDSAGAVRALGAEVEVSGTLVDSFGLLAIQPSAVASLGNGKRVKPHKQRTGSVGEATEGSLVRAVGVITQGPVVDGDFGHKFFIDDGSGEITVFVNLGTNVDVQGLAVGQLIEVTGFSSQFTDHYEIDIRGPQDLAQPVR